MHKINKIRLDVPNFLQITSGIANMPKSLYLIGKLPESRQKTVAIVGTRKPTSYGREVTYQLSYKLASHGVIIVSGLALGVDAIAHQAALDAGGITIAVLPTPCDNIHPRTHLSLASRIIQQGGALVSEYAPGENINKVNFIARNRLVAAIADGVVITEAAPKSGTLHTAGFAIEYGRPVMAVPGNITSPTSSGTNTLIKTGARVVTELRDILEEIGLRAPVQPQLPLADTASESAVLALLGRGVRDGEELRKQSGLPASEFAQTMTMLELAQKIRPLGGNNWGL